MAQNILINHCKIVREPSLLQKNGYVRIVGDRITEVGSMNELTSPAADLVIDGTDRLLVPGLINGHNHSPMTLFRGMADDLELHEWLHGHIFPAEANHVTEEMVYWCSKLAAAEMLLSGTTCVADGYFLTSQTARAFEEAGIRAVVAHGVIDFPAPGVADPAKNIETVERYLQGWKLRNTRITPAVFAHSPYTCSPATLQKAKHLADAYGVRFFIHLAETANEQHMVIDPQGKTPLQHLHQLGIVDENCVLIHAIWLNDEDLDILAASSAHVVLCPQSNYKLASGKSRAVDMMRRGIAVGIGTDSCASNNSLDMFREMDIFAKSQKVFESNPTVFPAGQVFEAATKNNNDILGLSSNNYIHPGSRADVVLINLKTPHLTPFYNQDLLVYSIRGNDVDTVIVEGEIVVENRELKTFDLREAQDAVIQLAEPLRRNTA